MSKAPLFNNSSSLTKSRTSKGKIHHFKPDKTSSNSPGGDDKRKCLTIRSVSSEESFSDIMVDFYWLFLLIFIGVPLLLAFFKIY